MKSILSLCRLSLLLAVAALPLSACAVGPADDGDEKVEPANPERVGESEDALTTLIPDKQISGQQSQDGPALTMYNTPWEVVMVHRGQSSSNLYMSTFDGSSWTTNQQIPGQTSNVTVALAQHSDGQIHMVHPCDGQNHFCHYANPSTSASQWTKIEQMSFASSVAPALVSDPVTQKLMVVWNPGFTSQQMFFSLYNPGQGGWGPAQTFTDLTGMSAQAPSLTVFNGHTFMAYTVQTGEIRTAEFTSAGWTNRNSSGRVSRSAVSLTAFAGRLYAVHRGQNDNTIWWASSSDGINFTSDQAPPSGGQTQGSPAVVTFGLEMVLAHNGSSSSNLYFSTYQN